MKADFFSFLFLMISLYAAHACKPRLPWRRPATRTSPRNKGIESAVVASLLALSVFSTNHAALAATQEGVPPVVQPIRNVQAPTPPDYVPSSRILGKKAWLDIFGRLDFIEYNMEHTLFTKQDAAAMRSDMMRQTYMLFSLTPLYTEGVKKIFEKFK
jgi:hypothetical protein